MPPSWSSPVPNAGQWLGSIPAGCEVCRESPAETRAPPWTKTEPSMPSTHERNSDEKLACRISPHVRPDTYQRLPPARPSLAKRSRFSNRSSAVKTSFYVARPGHGSLRGQRGLPQHLVRSGSTGIARSTTGLRLITCPRPRPRNCLHPRPGATRLSASCGRVSIRYAAMVCGAQRNGSRIARRCAG